MELLELVLAAACFAVGGLFMKHAAGVSRPLPQPPHLHCFLAVVAPQSLGMRRFDGAAYIAVLGLEAALAFLLSVAVLHESYWWNYYRHRADSRESRYCGSTDCGFRPQNLINRDLLQ